MMLTNSNLFLTFVQGYVLDFQNLMTLLAFVGSGIGALFVYLTNRDKQKLQARLIEDQKRLETDLEKAKIETELVKKERELELEQVKAQFLADIAIAQQQAQANLDEQRDLREEKQQQDRLAREYQRAEGRVAHEITAEQLDKVIDFLIKQVYESLDRIKADTTLLPNISKRLGEVEHQGRNILTYQQIANERYVDTEKSKHHD